MDEVYKNRQGFLIPQEHIPSDDDMRRYAESDGTIIVILNEGLTGYIVNSVEWFLSHSHTAQPYGEDCISEALFELCSFTQKKLGRKYSPQHFMSAAKLSCLSAVKKWLREMSITVTLPASTSRENNITLVRNKLNSVDRLTGSDPVFREVWFHEFLGMLDHFDKKLVELRMAGYTDRRIGREIGMEQNHVKKHLLRISNLYLEGE